MLWPLRSEARNVLVGFLHELDDYYRTAAMWGWPQKTLRYGCSYYARRGWWAVAVPV